jgi:hypothetical protein
MSYAEIEAELEKLSSDELRRLALKSWHAFVAKEVGSDPANECSEDDESLISALDSAMARADAAPGQGLSGSEVRARLARWTSR